MSAWSRLFLAALLVSTFALGMFGIGRSLWLDESWVANSIHAPTLRDMFYYPEWLQTSPPLFLLLSRTVVSLAGMSNAAFRLVPLAAALIATWAMFSLSRRVLSIPSAVLATALVVFHPAFIEYSHSTKQYSGEVAAIVLVMLAMVRYLEFPSARSYLLLTAVVVVAFTAAYPVAFLLPGMLAALGSTNLRRAAALATSAGATILILWVVLIRPNTASELQVFWRADGEVLFTPGLIGAVCLVSLLCLRLLGLRLLAGRGPLGPRQWTQLICGIPCLLLAVASVAGWYPANQRMRLWVLPCFILLCVIATEDLFKRLLPKAWGPLALGFALFFATVNVSSQIRDRRDLPEEDAEGAFQYLKFHVQPADLLLIHPAAREGFRLYSAILGWSGPTPVYGATGWPCCARGRNALPGRSTRSAVASDLNTMIPPGFKGNIWLYYPTRPSHWKYVGMDEGDYWRKLVWERGCPPGPYVSLKNLAISPMECGSNPVGPSTPIR